MNRGAFRFDISQLKGGHSVDGQHPSREDLLSLHPTTLGKLAIRAIRRVQSLIQFSRADSRFRFEDILLTYELLFSHRISPLEFGRRSKGLISNAKFLSDETVAPPQSGYREALINFISLVQERLRPEDYRAFKLRLASLVQDIARISTDIAPVEHQDEVRNALALDVETARLLRYHSKSLWPTEPPEWAADTPCRDFELVVEIEIPDHVTDDSAIESIIELADQIDDLHRSMGGGGLRVDSLEIFEDALVMEGVSNG